MGRSRSRDSSADTSRQGRGKKTSKKKKRRRSSSSSSSSSGSPTPLKKASHSLSKNQAMTDEQKARLSTKRPLTKEGYEAKQSVIRRVVDPETGHTRLIRGEGEIIEEIVSKETQRDQQATKGDGNSFQKKLGWNR